MIIILIKKFKQLLLFSPVKLPQVEHNVENHSVLLENRNKSKINKSFFVCFYLLSIDQSTFICLLHINETMDTISEKEFYIAR